MTNIQTPEGWERSGPCFTRVYGGKFALLEHDPDDGDWYPTVYVAPGDSRDDTWLPLHDAVAWANEQLGVPKPVEVVRTEYKDAWILTCEQTGRSDRVSKDAKCRDYADIYVALQESEKYVRGDA